MTAFPIWALIGFASTEAGDEGIFLGLDGTFSGVGAMKVWGNELETYAGIVQKLFQAAGAFIVDHLLRGGGAAFGEVEVEDASGSDKFAFAVRGEWLR